MKISVYIKDPGKKPRHVAISDTLENLQRTVGGYIEVRSFASDAAIICNEDGKLRDLPYNCTVFGERFVGTIIFVGINGSSFCNFPVDINAMKMMFPDLWEDN